VRNGKAFQNSQVSVELLVDEVRIVAWSWLKIKANNLNYTLSQWCLNPKACLGVVKLFEF